ncbi:MAG: T9SS type A sorting domain-containing protein [Flavobacteriales bacterium]|nr:T9SS type A sorting domain-containing protein [Flavobacteriales bacterium]
MTTRPILFAALLLSLSRSTTAQPWDPVNSSPFPLPDPACATATVQDLGSAVAFDGDLAIVGAKASDTPGGDLDDLGGAVYVYVRQPNGQWQCADELLPPLPPSGTVNGMNFGYSVAVQGDILFVGAPNYTEVDGLPYGRVLIYRWNPLADADGEAIGPYNIVASLSPAPYEGFGRALDVSGDRLIVGAPQDNGPYPQPSGRAYVFAAPGGDWTSLTGTLLMPGGAVNEQDAYGHAVSILGDRAAVGAPGSGGDAGRVFVFDHLGSGWSLIDVLDDAMSSTEPQRFGTDLEIFNEGERLVIGAPLFSDGAGQFRGRAVIWHDDGSWNNFFNLEAPLDGPANAFFFGGSVHADADAVVVGPDKVSSVVRVFHKEFCGQPWPLVRQLDQPTPAASGFGHAVYTDGQTLLAGARSDNSGTGGVYGYVREVVEACTEMEFYINTDANGQYIRWEIREPGCPDVLCSGQGYDNNEKCQVTPCCLPDGDYVFQVYNDNPNVPFTGSYLLRSRAGGRIVDNLDGFTGPTALHGGTGAFSLPMGTTRLILDRCDMQTMRLAAPGITNFISANTPAGSQTRFHFFDPDGAPMGTITQASTTLPLATVVNQLGLVPYRIYNVRLTSVLGGVAQPYGPACYFRYIPAGEPFGCRPSRLVDLPGHVNHSCDVTLPFGSCASVVHAAEVQGMTQYRYIWTSSVGTYSFPRTTANPANNRMFHLINGGCTAGTNWTAPPPPANSEWMVCVEARAGAGQPWCGTGQCCRVRIGSGPIPVDQLIEQAGHVQGLDLWPNPNDGASLHLDVAWAGGAPMDVEFTDLSGRVVRRVALGTDGGEPAVEIALGRALPAGIYLVRAEAGGTRRTGRLVVN